MSFLADLGGQITRVRVLLGFLYITTVGLGYAFYLTYPGRLAIFYGGAWIVYTLLTAWAILDVRRHTDDPDSAHNYYAGHSADGHYLCSDPLCERCRGYYGGLTFSTTVTITLYRRGVQWIDTSSVSPGLVLVGGFILLVLTTPFQGVVRSSTRVLFDMAGLEDRVAHPNFFKTVMGFLSGTAVGVMAIAVLSLL